MSRSGRWIRRATRLAIFIRDKFECVYCGDLTIAVLTLDHVIPGDNHDPENLLTACYSCNSSRKDRPMREWLPIAAARSARMGNPRPFSQRKISLRVSRWRRRPLNAQLGCILDRALHKKLKLEDIADLVRGVPF